MIVCVCFEVTGLNCKHTNILVIFLLTGLNY